MTEFLTYELLSPETADPVVIRITGQRERLFKDFKATNRIMIFSTYRPDYYSIQKELSVWGSHSRYDAASVEIPLSDWPAVKQAIRELNEYYKETDMKEQDSYTFRESEWTCRNIHCCGTPLIVLTRKKPRVNDRENTPVKVEWRIAFDIIPSVGEWEIDYHIVQFRVTGWDGESEEEYMHYTIENAGHISMRLSGDHTISAFNMGMSIMSTHFFYVGSDARDKWSAPVLLPERIYAKLDEICRKLENKANEVQG